MKKKIALLAITILYLINMAICQSDKLFAHLSNDSVKFKILRVSLNFIGNGKVTSPQNLIKVAITSVDSKLLQKMKRSDWIKALSDPQTDWAANLLLYDMYKKDATTFIVTKNREEWIVSNMESDIEYWKKKLK